MRWRWFREPRCPSGASCSMRAASERSRAAVLPLPPPPPRPQPGQQRRGRGAGPIAGPQRSPNGHRNHRRRSQRSCSAAGEQRGQSAAAHTGIRVVSDRVRMGDWVGHHRAGPAACTRHGRPGQRPISAGRRGRGRVASEPGGSRWRTHSSASRCTFATACCVGHRRVSLTVRLHASRRQASPPRRGTEPFTPPVAVDHVAWIPGSRYATALAAQQRG